jgi:hypothetical protein
MFFFFFEQDAIDLLKQALQGEELLEVGQIEADYAYDYYLPKGCKTLGLPGNTAIEVKRNLAPGLFSILLSDAERAYMTGRFKHFLILYEEGVVYLDWIPERIKGFVSFLSKEQLRAKLPDYALAVSRLDGWREQRSMRIARLRNVFQQGQASLFVGAGLSSSLGVPGWGKLLKGLNDKVRKRADGHPGYKSIKNDSNGSYLIAARFLNEAAERNQLSFISEIRKQLYRKKQLRSSFMDAVIELLKQNRIGEIITYNYDIFLEQRMTEEEILNTPIDGQNRRVRNAIPVMHVHGLIHPEDAGFDNGVVLSEEAYHRLYQDSYHWANVAQLYALTHTTCIFVGLSMTDPSLRRLLDIAYQQGSKDAEHYAFLIRPEFDCHKETEGILSQMGVNTIWCEDRDDVPRQIMRLVD